MRLCLIVYGSLDLVSGGNLYDQKLLTHLRERGHEVDVLSFSHGSYVRHLAQNYSPSLKQKLLEGSFDLLLQDELVHPSLFRLNHGLSCPIVSIVHHLRSNEDRPDWQNDFYRSVEKRYLATVHAFVFNSETTRESVETMLGIKTLNVVASPGGDRLPRSLTGPQVYERALQGGTLKLLFVGNLIERKGLHVLLDALGKLREHDWHLDVVGSPDMDAAYASRVQRKIDELGLRSRITMHGTLDGESLAQRYRESQVLAVPSSYEGFGIVYLEAMGFGLPVIAGASGATDEIVRHETTGFLVPPGDTFSLTRQLEQLMVDRELLSRLSLGAFESFDQHPTWAQSMNAIEEFLVSVHDRP